MDQRAITVEMPDLGDTEEAVVVQWLHDIGTLVHEGEDLLEVETAKTTFVIAAPADGVLREILTPEGAVVPQHAELGRLDPA